MKLIRIKKIITIALSCFLISQNTVSLCKSQLNPNYDMFEGEYITVNGVEASNVTGMEILGNTVQDPNNLSNIESVGELYADESGRPILDANGNEQYKISILSTNKNLIHSLEYNSLGSNGEQIGNQGKKRILTDFIKIDPNKHYRLSNESKDAPQVICFIFSKDKKLIRNNGWNSNYYNNIQSYESNAYYVRYEFATTIPTVSDLDINSIKVQLEEGTVATPYIPHESNKSSILMPVQLGNDDRLYWCDVEKAWCIDKVETELVLNGSERWTMSEQSPNSRFLLERSGIKFGTGVMVISDKYKGVSWADIYNNLNITGIAIHNTSSTIVIRDGNLPTQALSEFKKKLSKTNPIIKYQSSTPTKIILPQDQQIALNSFFGTTHIFTEDMIVEPTFKAKVSKSIGATVSSLGVKTDILKEKNNKKIPLYNGTTHIYVESNNGVYPHMKIWIDGRLERLARKAVEDFEASPTTINLKLARDLVNQLPECTLKDELNNRLNAITSLEGMSFVKKNASSNMDLYIKSENILSLSLDTNSVMFEDFSGIDDEEKKNAVSLTIDSSLPYQINATMETPIQNSSGDSIFDKSLLNIKENSQSDYKIFNTIGEKITLIDSIPAGNNLVNNIDILLKSGTAHKKDVYKTVIKLEIAQQ